MNIQFAINSPGYLAFEKMGQLKENVAQGQGCLLGNFLDAHLVVYNFFRHDLRELRYPPAGVDDALFHRMGLGSMAEICGFEGGGSQYRMLFSKLDTVYDLYYASYFEEPDEISITTQDVSDAVALVDRVYAWILSELTEEGPLE